MAELLDIVDSQGELVSYLHDLDIKTPSEVILNYPELMARCKSYRGKLGEKWNEVVKTINLHLQDKFPKDNTPKCIFIESYNEPGCHIEISKLRNTNVGKIVVLEGIVRKVTESKERVVYSEWTCLSCNRNIKTCNERPPLQCDCGKKKFALFPEGCIYQDIQYISLQEAQAVGNRQPKNIKCRLSGSMVDSLQVGARCSITGIVKVDVNDDMIGTLWIEVIGLDKPEDDYLDITITEQDKQDIIRLSEDRDVYRLLGNSINPAIWGYDEVKVSLVLQMFGGVTIEADNNAERIRGDSHILLCGDPSMAKSQLIRSVAKIIPNCVYTSGKSTSAAGLTVAAVRDESTGQWTLEAGALVLANGAFCVVDELDKMSAEDRSALHEAMESQSISVSKAGISQTLKTACPMLCAANPKMGRFIKEMPFADQINLPPALMSRFDLIFMLLDKPNEEYDTKVAKRILDLSDEALDGKLTRPVSIDLFRKYLIYSKQFTPRLTDEVKDYLTKEYIHIRTDGYSSITPRQLEALKRLTQSAARVQLRNECTLDNAKLAVTLFNFSMNTITLGKGIDTSYFDSNNTIHMTKEYSKVYNLIRENNSIPFKALIRLATEHGISEVDCNSILFDMIDNGTVKTERVDNTTCLKV